MRSTLVLFALSAFSAESSEASLRLISAACAGVGGKVSLGGACGGSTYCARAKREAAAVPTSIRKVRRFGFIPGFIQRLRGQLQCGRRTDPRKCRKPGSSLNKDWTKGYGAHTLYDDRYRCDRRRVLRAAPAIVCIMSRIYLGSSGVTSCCSAEGSSGALGFYGFACGVSRIDLQQSGKHDVKYQRLHLVYILFSS